MGRISRELFKPGVDEEGMIVYDSVANDFLGYANNTWKTIKKGSLFCITTIQFFYSTRSNNNAKNKV